MNIFFKIIAIISLILGSIFLLVSLRMCVNKVILDNIAKNGTPLHGIVDSVNYNNKFEIYTILDNKQVVKEVSLSEGYYQEGDSITLIHYARFPNRYKFKNEYIEYFQIMMSLIVTGSILLPALLYQYIKSTRR